MTKQELNENTRDLYDDIPIGLPREEKSTQLVSLLDELDKMIKAMRPLSEIIDGSRTGSKFFLIDPSPGTAEDELARLLSEIAERVDAAQVVVADLKLQTMERHWSGPRGKTHGTGTILSDSKRYDDYHIKPRIFDKQENTDLLDIRTYDSLGSTCRGGEYGQDDPGSC